MDTADSLASYGFLSVSASGEKLSFTRAGNKYYRIIHALFELRNEIEAITRLKRNDKWKETDLAYRLVEQPGLRVF